jgi:hypothetical protein
MKVINQVNQTTDYGKFQSLNGNRNVNALHVRRLQESFAKSYLLSPILVNDKFEIIDGQHRFEAAKKLNLPINFISIPNYGLEQVQLLNTNMKNWKSEDYLQGFCDLKYPEYLKFRNFMRQFPSFLFQGCDILLNDTSNGSDKQQNSKELITKTNKAGDYNKNLFKEGELKIPNYEKSVANANNLMRLKDYYEGYNRTIFIRTMVVLFKHENFDFEVFISKVKLNPTSLKPCVSVTDTKLLIEEIYNYRNQNKVSLRY